MENPMKTHVLLAVLFSLTAACSSSASDRRSTNDERQAAINRDRDRDRQEHAQDPEHARGEITEDMMEGDNPPRAPEEDAPRAASDEDRATPSREPDERKPDNTGRNERDDEPGNLTALDQSNSASDVDITQAIRKEVIANDALSFNAKNVKIITVSGKVTLRGPVESAKESSAIEKSARAVPGVVQVDNQIEVKR
jgi:hyperosmotically inducible protein